MSRGDAVSPDTLALLRLMVDEFDGSVIGSPAELVHDGRAVASTAGSDWRATGWPATGVGLVKLLDRNADELAAAGLLACHTPEMPGQPEWLAVSDATAELRSGHRLTSLGTPDLADRLEAVLRHLAGRGGWSGSLDEVQWGWRLLPDSQRDSLPGPRWPASTDALRSAIRLCGGELDRRGVVVTSDGVTVTLAVTDVAA